MIKYTNGTTKEQFLAAIDWAEMTLEKIKAQFSHQQEWIIRDRFANAWKLVFMGNVNQYRIQNLQNDPYFEVDMLAYGDFFEIHHAYDHGKTITLIVGCGNIKSWAVWLVIIFVLIC